MNRVMNQNILDLKDQYDVFVLDLYGVIWKGTEFFPRALEHMISLREDGKKIILLSNYPCLSATVEKMWEAKGMIKGVHYDSLMTSGQAAHNLMVKKEKKVYYWLLGYHPLDIFVGTPYVKAKSPQAADIIFAGEPLLFTQKGWKEQASIGRYAAAMDKLLALKKPMLCVNPDQLSHSNQVGGMAVRAGALADYYEQHGGTVRYIGKPDPYLFEAALANETVDRSQVAMVGDMLETDILGGRNAGIGTILTLCGVTYERMLKAGETDILRFAEKTGIVPTHCISEL